jgi:hypothetical protein
MDKRRKMERVKLIRYTVSNYVNVAMYPLYNCNILLKILGISISVCTDAPY